MSVGLAGLARELCGEQRLSDVSGAWIPARKHILFTNVVSFKHRFVTMNQQ